MDFAYDVGGGQIVSMPMQIGASLAAGQTVITAGDNTQGLTAAGTTTENANVVGLLTAATTHATAQQTDASDPQGSAEVIVNPSIAIKSRISGGAAAGTVLTPIVATAADATGLTLGTAGGTDRFAVWGYSGANTGHQRIQSAADGVPVAFPHDVAIGDEWIQVSCGYNLTDVFPTLCTELTEVRADSAVDLNNNNFRVFAIEGNSRSHNGANRSFVYMTVYDHVMNGNT